MPHEDEKYDYDVFVSYSHDDAEWVSEWLVPRLCEESLRVYWDREFLVGASVLESIESAVKRSDKTLLVLTPKWRESEWAGLESLIARGGDLTGRRRRVITLMLKECDPPEYEAPFIRADFTRPESWGRELARVIRSIKGESSAQQDAAPDNASDVPFVLPLQFDASTFTGREEELARLEALLVSGGEGAKVCSIVSVEGAGGVGKSALAFHFAAEHRSEFPDGVIGLRVDGKDVEAVAREFARYCGEVIDPEDERLANVLMSEVFAHRRVLLIFDNADDVSIAALRPGGDRCAVIITTRDQQLPFLLGIPPEGRIDLSPLPEDKALLLLEKLLGPARVAGEMGAAIKITGLVGHLPLALQIVGATLRLQTWRALSNYAESLAEGLSRLRVSGATHLDVRASLSLSLELLTREEADFFGCLSVCARDGFSVSAAVAAGGCDEATAHERLAQLVRRSLLNLRAPDEGRFAFHPLIRLLARELASERTLLDAASERHALHFIELVKSVDEDDPPAAPLAAELDDIVLAAEWLQRREMIDHEFLIPLQSLLQNHGYWQQAVELISGFLELAARAGDALAEARLRIQQAKFHTLLGDLDHAKGAITLVPDVLIRVGSKYMSLRLEAMWLNTLGVIDQRLGRFDRAAEVLQRSAEIEKELGSLPGEAKALNSLGGVLQRQGSFDEASAVFRRCLEIEERLGSERGQAIVLNSLGGVLQRQGHFNDAVAAFERGLELLVRLGDPRGQAMVLTSLGGVFQRQGRFKHAEDAFRRSIEIEERINNRRGKAIVLNSLGGVLQRMERLDESAEAFRRSIEIEEQLNNRRGLAMTLNSLGGVLQRMDKLEQALGAFRHSYDLLSEQKDSRGQAMALNGIGGVLQRMGKFGEAHETLRRSYEILSEQGDEHGQAKVLDRMGGLLQKMDRLEEALDAFRRGIEIQQRLNDQLGLAILHANLGRALLYQGETEKGVAGLGVSFAINEELKNPQGIAIVVTTLVRALIGMGSRDEALKYCERALAVAPENRDILRLRKELLASPENALTVIRGTVKRALIQHPRGYRFGFIKPDDGSADVYFRGAAVEDGLLQKIKAGLRVEAEVGPGHKGREARWVRELPQ